MERKTRYEYLKNRALILISIYMYIYIYTSYKPVRYTGKLLKIKSKLFFILPTYQNDLLIVKMSNLL